MRKKGDIIKDDIIIRLECDNSIVEIYIENIHFKGFKEKMVLELEKAEKKKACNKLSFVIYEKRLGAYNSKDENTYGFLLSLEIIIETITNVIESFKFTKNLTYMTFLKGNIFTEKYYNDGKEHIYITKIVKPIVKKGVVYGK